MTSVAAGSLKFIFFTDFHGGEARYKNVLNLCQEHGVDLLVCGGDITPHRGGIPFLSGYFRGWLEGCAAGGISVFGMLGNDDLRTLQQILDSYESEGLFTRIDLRFVERGGWIFWGYNYVPDLPFGLKDWVKLDYPGAPRLSQFSRPVISGEEGYIAINDIEGFFASRGTIKEDLAQVELPQPSHTIIVSHSPPQGLGLDVCSDGRGVGSRSILEFIERSQPLISLHGHIHESPEMTGVWRCKIGKTWCCQPGVRPALIAIHGGAVNLTRL